MDTEFDRALSDTLENLDGMGLADLGQLRRALVRALDDVNEALAPLMSAAYERGGMTQQRIAELSGYSIQGVRNVVVAGAREYNREIRKRGAVMDTRDQQRERREQLNEAMR